MRVTILLNLFMLGSEVFTAFYTGGGHGVAAKYLFFGAHGKNVLVPWIWSAVALNVASAILLHAPRARSDLRLVNAGCVTAFVGVWIEKGMGLIIPGFVPSTLHEMVEYVPSLTEWRVTAGIWALGLLVLTVAIKVAHPVLVGKLAFTRPEGAEQE
jgi:molybdopterin-containing oxidoreductase family membrane subunit